MRLLLPDRTGIDTPTGLTGYELEDLIQSTDFYTLGYNGANIQVGISESDADQLHRAHPGFKNSAGTQRVRNCKPNPAIQSIPCSNYNPSPFSATDATDHATACASIMVGDITAGQDANYTADVDRRERSGVARGALLVGVDTVSSSWVNYYTMPRMMSSLPAFMARARE